MPVVTAQQPLPTTPPVAAPIPVPEAPVTAPLEGAPASDEAKKQELLSPKFAQLARKEKELRRIQQEVQAERAAIKAREEEFKTNYIPKERLTTDTMQALLEAGVTHDKIALLALNQPSPQDQTISELKAELAQIRAAQKQAEVKMEDQSKAQYEQALTQIRNETKLLVDSDAEYETIKEMGAAEAVVQLIRETFEADGTLLTVQDAAVQVENHLLEEALKMARFKKVQAKLTPQAPTEEAPIEKSLAGAVQAKKSQAPQQQIKTLTNAQNASSSKPQSWKEKRERLIAIAEGRAVI